MRAFLRKFAFVLLLAGVMVSMNSMPVEAKTHKKHHVTRHHAKAKKAKSSSMIHAAQRHLSNLGYYHGNADGLYGPKTKKALSKFQKEHGLRATGTLTAATYSALLEADRQAPVVGMYETEKRWVPKQDFYAANPDFYGHYDQHYANPMMLGSPQTMPNRYAKLDVSETVRGTTKAYVISLNGETIAGVDNQPAVIGISRTFQMEDEDAFILSAYKDGDPVCAYQHYLLTLSSAGKKLHEIENCTHGYQAQMNQGSLFITFPQTARAVGSTWRYEKSTGLEKL